jgi:hypothetical protein
VNDDLGWLGHAEVSLHLVEAGLGRRGGRREASGRKKKDSVKLPKTGDSDTLNDEGGYEQ